MTHVLEIRIFCLFYACCSNRTVFIDLHAYICLYFYKKMHAYK